MDSLNILLAEDHRLNRRLALTLLERRGHRVTVAVDGVEALDAIERGPFDLVLMDIHMPNMDGLEATRRIRAADAPWSTVPIIAVTALSSPDDRERCFAAGVDEFVEKPLRIELLEEAIRRVIDRPAVR